MLEYRSPFRHWDQQSTVRTKQAADYRRELRPDRAWFPASRSFFSNHAAVAESDRKHIVLAAELLNYLDFTIRLETDWIIPVARDIVARAIDGDYEASVVRDALCLQCDESYHALICEELAENVAQETGLKRASNSDHEFFRIARRLRDHSRAAISSAQFGFCVAFVAETVITESLQEDWQDHSLDDSVRALLFHHHRDESRHSAFFMQLLPMVWRRWPDSAREAMKPIWGELVQAFTRIDEDAASTILEVSGFGVEDARRIAQECRAARGESADRAACSALTLRGLQRAEALLHV